MRLFADTPMMRLFVLVPASQPMLKDADLPDEARHHASYVLQDRKEAVNSVSTVAQAYCMEGLVSV